ncbi:hypothetical protein [Gloeothece verrucosa]|uniref:Uncharacterized protein n=1 Tax=Gloeothece verrucosa (strain PCC 7822) TaxID=497965 RepID=E0ULF0_GLOV7|nr:hypothetical protein [Gloeothece verrucosa]ADN17780.1 conserved hypothetical protein [Gloeothece verrucosa PCC 7822]
MDGLKREIKKLGFLTLFFFICFGYILLLMKLFLEDYEINTYVLSKAIIGALVAAKAVAIMDSTPLFKRFLQSPRYISILYKTFFYSLTVIVIGVIENLFHAYKETKNMGAAIVKFVETRNIHHFFAVILCIGVVFLIYNIYDEVNIYFGKGKVKNFFLERP